MSASISSRERDGSVSQWRGDRSVGSCRSSKSGSRNGGSRSGSRSGSASLSSSSLSQTRRYVIDDDNENNAMYLPSSLLQKQQRHQTPSMDCDEKSLQELDDTVASVTKQYSSLSLDKGETSPTSVSYDVSGSSYAKDPLQEKVIRHLTGALPLDRVESVSGRSILSRNSRSSRGSRASLGSRSSRRNDKLERRIYQTILENETEITDFSYSIKECSDSACRSAQFILTDLFHEASKAMNDEAMPQRPYSSEESSEGGRGLPLPASLPPRHPDGQNFVDDLQASVAPSSPANRHPPSHPADNEATTQNNQNSNSTSTSHSNLNQEPPGKTDNTTSDTDRHTTAMSPPGRIGVIKEGENESETSSFYVFDMQDQTAANDPPIKRENSMSNASSSDCTGPLNYSMDELQYSTTNGTSYSQQGRDTPVSFSSKSIVDQETFEENEPSPCEQAVEPTEEVISGGDDWTCFDASPFQDESFADDFGFDPFLGFESDISKSQQRVETAPKQEEIDPAWDTTKTIPVGPSPNSPASVFNFFTEYVEAGIDDGDDEVHSGAEGIWNIGESDFQDTNRGYIESKASF